MLERFEGLGGYSRSGIGGTNLCLYRLGIQAGRKVDVVRTVGVQTVQDAVAVIDLHHLGREGIHDGRILPTLQDQRKEGGSRKVAVGQAEGNIGDPKAGVYAKAFFA